MRRQLTVGLTAAFGACAIALGLGALVGIAIPPRKPADAFVPVEALERA